MASVLQKIIRWGVRDALAFAGARPLTDAPLKRDWAANPDPDVSVSQPELRISDGGVDYFIDALLIVPPHKPQRSILISQGNGCQLRSSFTFLKVLAIRSGCTVLAYEYPGYGSSEGVPSERSCNLAIVAAFQFLTGIALSQPLAPIVLVGVSIGSGPTIHLAASEAGAQVAGVVLWSGFATGAHAFLGPIWARLFRSLDLYRNIDITDRISKPVFIMHALGDRIVPIQDAMAMRAACHRFATKPFWINDAVHAFTMPCRACFEGIKAFADLLEQAQKEKWPLDRWQDHAGPQEAAQRALGGLDLRLPADDYIAHPNSHKKVEFVAACMLISGAFWLSFLCASPVWLGRLGNVIAAVLGCILCIYALAPNMFIPPVPFMPILVCVACVGVLFHTASWSKWFDAWVVSTSRAAAFVFVFLLLSAWSSEQMQKLFYLARHRRFKAGQSAATVPLLCEI